MTNAKPFADVPVLPCLFCTSQSSFSPLQQKRITLTIKENDLTSTPVVHTLNTRCILLLGQPNDAYACSLIDVFLALSATNNKLYWQSVLSTSRPWDKPRPTTHRTRYSEELCSCDHVLSVLELPPTSWVTPFSACRMEEALLGH